MVAIQNLFVKYIQLREKLDKGKIYQIVDKTNDNKYIGSTCGTLKKRLSKHKSDYNRFLKGLGGNVKSFDIIKNNDYVIELLEDCQVKSKSGLFARERFYIENNNCLNKCIPGRTYKEYYIDNKEKYKENRKEYCKEYYDNNKEKFDEQKKEKFECDCGGRYSHTNKARHINSKKHQKYLETLK